MVNMIKKIINNLFNNKEEIDMKKVLYITANPKSEEYSYSLKTGRKFINQYKDKNPNDEIIEIDVYKEEIPLLDSDVFNAWGKLQNGISFNELTDTEKSKVGRISELTEQFISADKYVFVTPLWNFSFPPMMKAYIDTFVVAGKTFKYGDNGPVGLLNNKKAVHIQASGGVYSEGPASAFEHGNTYLKTVLGFIGIRDVESILVEGTNQSTPGPEAVKEKANEIVKSVIENF